MKRVLIMGASSGIGLAVAEAYAASGATVGLAARRVEPLKELKDKYPASVEYAAIDVNDIDGPDKLRALIERLGGMDIYLHVAGIGYDNPQLDPDREANMIATNAAGFARMVATAYDYFKSHNVKGAQLVAITSVAGTNGIGPMAAYSASKKCAQTYLVALEQLARLEKVDISFTDIRPGWIKTPLLDPDKHYPMEMQLGSVIPQILHAIERRKRVAIIDWRFRLLVFLWRLLPTSLWIRLNPSFSLPNR